MRSNWSEVGFIAGMIWVLGFAFRYIFIWQDYSQAVIFVGLGLGLMAFSWIYDNILNLNNKLTAIEDYIDENCKPKGI